MVLVHIGNLRGSYIGISVLAILTSCGLYPRTPHGLLFFTIQSKLSGFGFEMAFALCVREVCGNDNNFLNKHTIMHMLSFLSQFW